MIITIDVLSNQFYHTQQFTTKSNQADTPKQGNLSDHSILDSNCLMIS